MKKSKHEYLLHVALHPIEGFEEFTYYKAGSLPLSLAILAVWILVKVIERQATNFIHNLNNLESLNMFYILTQTIIIFSLWCVANWAFCTLMDGKGTFGNIWISSSYALLPMISCMLISTILSNFLAKDEQIFLSLITILGNAWSAWLLICAIRTIHDYSFGKTLLSIVLTLFGILSIIFVLILSISLYMQVLQLFIALFYELKLRF